MSELRILKITTGLMRCVVVLCVLPPREHHKEMRVRSVEPIKKGANYEKVNRESKKR